MDHKPVRVMPLEQAAKASKHLILPIALRFVQTDNGEKEVLKITSRLVVPGHLLDIFKRDLHKKKQLRGLTPRQSSTGTSLVYDHRCQFSLDPDDVRILRRIPPS